MVSGKGKIKARVGGCEKDEKESEKFGLEYCENIRESHLKINDDRKIKINLSKLTKNGYMMLLVIRSRDMRKEAAPKEKEFDNAWYRLNNEDTN